MHGLSKKTHLILDDIFQFLVEGHQLLLVGELVRQVEPEPGPQLRLLGFLGSLLGLLVHAQVEVGARQVDQGVFGDL